MLGLPTKFTDQFLRAGAQNRRIARSSGSLVNPDLHVRNLLDCPPDLSHRIAPAGADVIDVKSWCIHLLQSENVSLDDVHNVHIVAKTCAVWSRVISAIHLKEFPAPRGNLQKERNDVSLWVVSFSPG